MSQSTSSTFSLGFPWLIMFIVIKVWGVAFATWSWWWSLLAIVPDVWLICHKFGLI